MSTIGSEILPLSGNLTFNTVCGPSIAAASMAMSTVHFACTRPTRLGKFAVRLASASRVGKAVEPATVDGRRFLLIDDTAATGDSLRGSLGKPAQAGGACVVDIRVLVDRLTTAPMFCDGVSFLRSFLKLRELQDEGCSL